MLPFDERFKQKKCKRPRLWPCCNWDHNLTWFRLVQLEARQQWCRCSWTFARHLGIKMMNISLKRYLKTNSKKCLQHVIMKSGEQHFSVFVLFISDCRWCDKISPAVGIFAGELKPCTKWPSVRRRGRGRRTKAKDLTQRLSWDFLKIHMDSYGFMARSGLKIRPWWSWQRSSRKRQESQKYWCAGWISVSSTDKSKKDEISQQARCFRWLKHRMIHQREWY